MQGTYKDKGLPRPYYMKPSVKFSPYYGKQISFFNNNNRKLIGYIILLLLFGTCMYWISQDMKPKPDPVYEIIPKNVLGGQGSLLNVDKEIENKDLAGNLAQGSKGEIGKGVDEAPKGGTANEAPLADIKIDNSGEIKAENLADTHA